MIKRCFGGHGAVTAALRRGLLLEALVLGGLFTSCAAAEESAALSIYQTKKIIPLFSADAQEDEKAPRLSVSFTLPASTGRRAALLNKVLYDGVTPEEYASAKIDALTAEYRRSNQILDEPPEVPSAAPPYAWEYLEETAVTYAENGVLVCERTVYAFSGGAHGSTQIQWFVIDEKAGAQVRIGDIVAGGALPLLNERIKAALAGRGLPAEGFEQADYVRANFFLSPSGLGIQYDDYELAPHAEGLITVELPFSALGGILNKKGTALAARLKTAA
ncbi:MAG: DUF3298 and DUF4163 domain-containing protein [Treponema sp.]|jgi:hypothetical protein|nr:DUF3298 and DUF4163 domain-containing protein [Treponema sp.]